MSKRIVRPWEKAMKRDHANNLARSVAQENVQQLVNAVLNDSFAGLLQRTRVEGNGLALRDHTGRSSLQPFQEEPMATKRKATAKKPKKKSAVGKKKSAR